jgi:transcriptional regulator with XRE-family HTH domain
MNIIDDLLQKHNLTYSDLAVRLGYSEIAIRKIRNGERKLTDGLKYIINTKFKIKLKDIRIDEKQGKSR